MTKPILQKDDPRLRQVAKPVRPEMIITPPIQQLLSNLDAALLSQPDGVAIAAPQLGVLERVFLVSGRALLVSPSEKPSAKAPPPRNLVFINPKITRRSKKIVWLEEGCLSVRWLYGRVPRSEKVTVTAFDEAGQRFTRHASGLLAQICQHEIDHLDGILFLDKAKDVVEIKPA